MSFQWQPLDEAAKTLGVDLETLKTLIEQGRAPTRTHRGHVEVLIEFPDDDEADDSPTDDADDSRPGEPTDDDARHAADDAHAADADAADTARAADEVIDAEPVDRDSAGGQLVTRRELQLAGGIAATWQRMAEQTERELHRSRRLAAWGWATLGLVVLLVTVLGGTGIYFATRTTADAERDARLAQQQLQHVQDDRDAHRERVEKLEATREALAEALAETRAELARTTERAEQLTSRTTDNSTEHQRTVAALERSIEHQQARIEQLNEALTATSTAAPNNGSAAEAADRELQQADAASTADPPPPDPAGEASEPTAPAEKEDEEEEEADDDDDPPAGDDARDADEDGDEPARHIADD